MLIAARRIWAHGCTEVVRRVISFLKKNATVSVHVSFWTLPFSQINALFFFNLFLLPASSRAYRYYSLVLYTFRISSEIRESLQTTTSNRSRQRIGSTYVAAILSRLCSCCFQQCDDDGRSEAPRFIYFRSPLPRFRQKNYYYNSVT
jgi:hypothetical protein